MSFRPTSRLLARLRASSHLAVLVLLVFALKIGTAAACAGHDFADMGLGSGGDHALVVSVSDMDVSDDASTTLSSHAGACSHCSSHHAAALIPTASTFVVIAQGGLDATLLGLPPSASLSFELRPPIA
jgi:hypothetical protein